RLEHHRRHGDGDEQISARPELEKRAARAALERRNHDCRDELVRRARGLARPDNEIRERKRAVTARALQLDLRVEREERRDAVRGRRGIAEVAGKGPRVLYLVAADLA